MTRRQHDDGPQGDHRGQYRYRKRRHHEQSSTDGDHRGHGHCGVGGAINRVIRKSRDITGLGKGMIIAAYVLGFIFVPLLTGLVFLALLYWSTYPDSAQRNADRLSRQARRAARSMSGGGMNGSRPATEPHMEDMDLEDVEAAAPPKRNREPEGPEPSSPGALRARFEKLEKRARTIEQFVASEEYRLQREFDKMDDDRGPKER